MSHRKMNWYIFTYRYTGDDLVVFTDGFRWVAFDVVGLSLVNYLTDTFLRFYYAVEKYNFPSFDSVFSDASCSAYIPCGYNFGLEFERERLSHIALVCEGA